MLKQAMLAWALMIAVPLGGCQTLFGPPTETQEEIIKTAQQTLITAHNVHKAAGETLIALANAGVLTGASAALAKQYYNEASEWLQKADAAYDVGNAVLTKQYAEAAIRAVALATTQKGN